MLGEDVATCTPDIYRVATDSSRSVARDHFLFSLLARPNGWQDWMEFCEQVMFSLVMRGNGYAAILPQLLTR